MSEQKFQPEFKSVTVKNEGKQIVLPEGMNYVTAIKWITRRMEEDERVVGIHETVDCLPLEGAYYLAKAIHNIFGFFDASKWSSPTFVALETGFGKTEQVFWGRLEIPNIEGALDTGVEVANGTVRFCLEGSIRKKMQPKVDELLAETRRIAKEQSIYKGKAIQLSFPEIGRRDFNPVLFQHRFLDTSKVKPEQLIFPTITGQLVNDTLFTPLRFTKAVRAAGIPLKRGVLLEGPYGCGKTLTQYVTAKYASENGWTYIALDNTNRLAEAMQFAKHYQPAVVAAEDIDRTDPDGERSDLMNELLNTIDGAAFKDAEIIVLLTTNHVENITPAMLRPGRLDAVIPVRPPDAAAVTRLIHLYAKGLLDPFETLNVVSAQLEGQIPAVIREVVERSKLSAIARTEGKGKLQLAEQDLIIAANGMMDHLELMKPRVEDDRSERVKAAELLAASVENAARLRIELPNLEGALTN